MFKSKIYTTPIWVSETEETEGHRMTFLYNDHYYYSVRRLDFV